MNVAAHPFAPGQPTIQKNTRRKNKTSVPITAEQARIDFLQAELSAAQARIVQLDASIVDKDQRVSVLMARLKLFEEKQTKDIYDKYFPANENQQPAHSTTVPPTHPPCPPRCHSRFCPPHPTPPDCSCSGHRHHPCHCQTQSQPQNSPARSHAANGVVDTIKNLTHEVSEIAKDTKLLKALMKRLGHVPQPPASDETFQTGASTSESQDDLTVPTAPSSPRQAGPSNESFASINEFISDIDQDPLNLQLPTNHP